MKNIYETIFLYTINLIYILYIILLLGVNIRAPEYIYYLTEFIKIYTGLLLIIFYNPYTYSKIKFTDFHRKLVFTGATYLLLSSVVVSKNISFLTNYIYYNLM